MCGILLTIGCNQEASVDTAVPSHITDESPEIDETQVTPQQDSNSRVGNDVKKLFHFTLSNEHPPNRNIRVLLNGQTIYEDEIKFGFSTSKNIEFEVSQGTSSLEVIDLVSDQKKSTTLNTQDGMYVAVSFWGDSISINQTKTEQARYD